MGGLIREWMKRAAAIDDDIKAARDAHWSEQEAYAEANGFYLLCEMLGADTSVGAVQGLRRLTADRDETRVEGEGAGLEWRHDGGWHVARSTCGLVSLSVSPSGAWSALVARRALGVGLAIGADDAERIASAKRAAEQALRDFARRLHMLAGCP